MSHHCETCEEVHALWMYRTPGDLICCAVGKSARQLRVHLSTYSPHLVAAIKHAWGFNS